MAALARQLATNQACRKYILFHQEGKLLENGRQLDDKARRSSLR
jgi:hypothetical protein